MSGFFKPSEIAGAKPVGTVPLCGACGLFRDCRSPKMRPYGEGGLKVLVVGTAPDPTDDDDDRPFTGPSGELLRSTLADAGFYLDEDAVATNAIICHAGSPPTTRQVDYCRPNLTVTLEEQRPNVVVTLGRAALESVLPLFWKAGVGVFDRWTGWQIPTDRFWLCPTFHPADLLRMRNSNLDRMFRDHLKAAFELGSVSLPQPVSTSGIRVLYDDRLVADELEYLTSKGGWVAVDYETNCLKPEYPKSEIVSCAVSDGETTLSFPWTRGSSDAVRKLLFAKSVRKIASNLKFEERWTRFEFGCGVVNWGWDVMLCAHCLDNRAGITGLKFQSFVKLGAPSYNDAVQPYLESNGGHYNRIRECDPDTLLRYGGTDALLEFWLAMQQRKEMGL